VLAIGFVPDRYDGNAERFEFLKCSQLRCGLMGKSISNAETETL
jgi:hypothetical protein